jgi:hypothetical protein
MKRLTFLLVFIISTSILGCGYFPLLSKLSPEYVLHSDDFFVSQQDCPAVYFALLNDSSKIEDVIVLDSSIKSALIYRELLFEGMNGCNRTTIDGRRYTFPNFDLPGIIFEGKIYFAVHHKWKSPGNQTDSILVCQIDFQNHSLN